jgi:DNA-binding transcriptional LysR family regulator
MHAYASAQYIRRNGKPDRIEDLDDHPIVSYSGTPAIHLRAVRWLETAGLDGRAPRKAVFSANSVLAMKYAIRAGIGVGLIPDYLTGEESDLVPVLEDAKLPTVPVYFAYPEELKSAKKVQVFRDFLVAKARQWKF